MSVRYAIRMAPGLYSNGPRCEPVPLEKAKLWTNVGHVKTHIQGAWSSHFNSEAYDETAEIVAVELTWTEKPMGNVRALMSEHAERKEAQRKRWAVESAKREVEEAEKMLARAKATLAGGQP